MSRRKALPHSEEAECAVLGALLLEPLRIAQVRTRLEPRDWYLERHRRLYETCLEVADAGSTTDVLTLQAHLEQAGTLRAVRTRWEDAGAVLQRLLAILEEDRPKALCGLQLTHLAESDAIGHHADQVAFVHRPEVYAPTDDRLRGLAEIVVAKHRHGETGIVELTWAGATTSFRNHPIPTPASPESPDLS